MAKNRFNSILDTIERVGNKLPHPATLFFLMAALVAVISAIGAGFELSAIPRQPAKPSKHVIF